MVDNFQAQLKKQTPYCEEVHAMERENNLEWF